MCLEMPNRYLQVTLENRRKLAEVIRLNKPALLFAPAMPDLHPDHVAAAELVNSARFDAKLSKTDLAGEPHWTPRLYGYYSTHRSSYPAPSFAVDVTQFWDKKIEAVTAYQSQIHAAGLVEKLAVTARYFGQCIDVRYAEPFAYCRTIKVTDPAVLLDF
jgi:LmbE family N-acetylglucosaminyl deacetylase